MIARPFRSRGTWSNTDLSLHRSVLHKGIPIHPNGPLQIKPWGQKEFALLDPDNNLLAFGQGL